MVAFDIGGVLTFIDKKCLEPVSATFFDEDFSLFQRGLLTPEHFLQKKSKQLDMDVFALECLFTRMVKLSTHASTIYDLKVPYFFMSNINEMHFRYFTTLLKPSAFAMRHSALSCRLGLLKPHSRFFWHAHKRLGLNAKRIAFIDDKRENLRSAEEAGFSTRWCKSAVMLPSLMRDLQLLRR